MKRDDGDVPADPMGSGPPSLEDDPPAADGVAAGELLPLVYDELRRVARARMAREASSHTLQATALVHEAFLRLGGPDLRFRDRGHFFRTAAETMRRILVDHARAKGRAKRGGDAGLTSPRPVNVLDLAAAPVPDILAFDDAIERLAAQLPTAAAVVRLRFYGGLTVDETAESLGLSPRTVDREWSFARAWLFQLLGG